MCAWLKSGKSMEALFEKELPVLLRIGQREERYDNTHILILSSKRNFVFQTRQGEM